MFETTPPQQQPDGIDLTELADPVAQVVAAELASSFIRLCMCRTEPVVERLARLEAVLGKPGVIGLEKRLMAQRLYRDIDRQVFDLVRRCVPLAHAEAAWSRIENLLREQFADVVGTAASFLISDDRDTAIQMATVATTMAARELRPRVAEILSQAGAPEDADGYPDAET